MSYTVLLLDEAEQDLLQIHAYVKHRFSASLALEIYQSLRDSILMLEQNPSLGPVIESLAALGMTNFRHLVVLKKNRVVYEVDETGLLIYVHLICHERQDYESVLRQRILRQ